MQVSPIEAQKLSKDASAKAASKIDNNAKGNGMVTLSFREATKLIYMREGLPGYMRGFTPSMLKNTLNAGSYFSMLYYFETNLRKTGLFPESQVLLLSSASARTVQSIISNPLVIIKTRFEVIGFKEYGGVLDACKQIV